jgi:pSer/pThr/pTyr-binding forkhead associated (FHA) protein
VFTLIIEDKDGSIADEYSFEEGTFIIGRSHSSDIILPADNVSRRHARLYTQNTECYVEDLGSSNGVYVNGKRIHGEQTLGRSAQIKIGDYYLHIEGSSYGHGPGNDDLISALPSDPEIESLGPAAIGNVPSAISIGSSLGRLVGSNLATQGRPFDITKTASLVGRGKDCAVTILDPSVSRIHAKILVDEIGTLSVEDLRSSNGTYINNQRVERQTFDHGDRVRFGNVEFIYEAPGGIEIAQDAAPPATRRTGLLITVIVLAVLVVALVVTGFLVRHKLFGPPSQADSHEENRQLDTRDEGLTGKFDELKDELETILEKAKEAAVKPDWPRAERRLKEAEQLLSEDPFEGIETRSSRSVQRKALEELKEYKKEAERKLRHERVIYNQFERFLIKDKNYPKAKTKLAKLTGPMKALAKRKVDEVKKSLVVQADTACKAGKINEARKLLENAQTLDFQDEKIRTQLKAGLTCPGPKPPTDALK